MRKIQFPIGTLVLVVLLLMSMAISTLAQPDPSLANGMNSGLPATTNPNEAPLGAPSATPGVGGSSPSLDLQISGNSNGSAGGGGEMGGMEAGMDKMEGMDQMMSQMGGMNNQNTINNATTSGMPSGNSTILAQLQATNAMIMQMITLLSSQQNGASLQPQLQTLYQMMANQTALIQMTNNTSMNMASGGNSGSMGGGGGMSMM